VATTYSSDTTPPLAVTVTPLYSNTTGLPVPPVWVEVVSLNLSVPTAHNVLITGQFSGSQGWTGGGPISWGLRVLMDGSQVDGAYVQVAGGPSTSRVLQIPAGAHVFSLQAFAQDANSMAPAGSTATLGARSFAVVDLGP
jgi:hypothetical protein